MTNEKTKLNLDFLKDWQTKAFKNIQKHRYSVLIIHRRAGKSVLAISYLLYKALSNPRKDLWYLWPYLNQTKSIAWEYLKKFAEQIPWAVTNNSDLIVRFSNWSSIRLFGWDNPDTLRGLNLSTIVIDEYADINPELYGKIIFPQINFHGEEGQSIFLWTPQGKNHFYKLRNETKNDDKRYRLKLDVEKSWTLSPELIEEAREQLHLSQFMQEYMCSFEAAVRGSYYAEYIENLIKEDRIQSSIYDPSLPVTVHIDLWIDDATAMIFTQYVWSRVYWIDYEEFNGKGFPYYMQLLKSKDYNYDTFYLPWDANVRDLSTGTTRLETFRKMSEGVAEVAIVARQKVEDGINAVREMFPNLYIDDGLEIQLDRLGMYEAKWDEKRQIFTKPIHNEFSHLADAMRYCATTYQNKTLVVNYEPPFTVDYDSLI